MEVAVDEFISIHSYTGGYTMDVISSTAFGMQVDSLKDKDNLFVKHAKAILNFGMDKPSLKIIIGGEL